MINKERGKKKYSESPIHKNLKQKIAEKLKLKGYDVTMEKTIGRRRVDVYAENESEIKIVEVVHTHDNTFPDIESEKQVTKEKICTLDHFFGSSSISVSFSTG